MIFDLGVEDSHELTLFDIRIVDPFALNEVMIGEHDEPFMDLAYLVGG